MNKEGYTKISNCSAGGVNINLKAFCRIFWIDTKLKNTLNYHHNNYIQ